MSIRIAEADLASSVDRESVVQLLDLYARDPMGGGKGLSDYAKAHLPTELARRPHRVVLLAFEEDEAVGLLIAFEGFSTFACRSLLNIHDFVVRPGSRRRGVGRALLERVEAIARDRGYGKLTLEVLEGNQPAQALYRSVGFLSYELDPAFGRALFWEKPIPQTV